MNMVGANNRRLCTLLLCLLLSCSLNCASGDDIYCLKSIIKSLDPFNNLSWSWNFTNATTDGFICDFVGIDCWNPRENRVLNIRLPDMGLKGRFPRGIKNCSSLTGLDLSNNNIYGTIPSDVSEILKFVVSLDLSANKFSGVIPASLGNCSYLNVLKLQNNSLSGRIPPQLGQLTRIKTFSVANNYLTGPVPNFANTSNITAESYANNSQNHTNTDKMSEDTSSEDRCSVEEVALVVPETDDPSLPVMTFRAWFLGLTSCALLIFLNTFFAFRTQPLTISAILMQIMVLPIGKFMASILPEKEFKVLGWSFTLNPGPFNMKEHVIITIFANCGVSYGGGDAYSIGAITVMKAYYQQSLSFLCGLFIVLTTQVLGYGWAGVLRRYLVDPVEMWWPSNLAQVSLFRALHEKEPNSKGMTRMKFFLIFFLASFAYYALPGYLFPILTFFSWVCWAWPHSITAQQIGSGYHGLGLGAFTLDWAGISAYHGSPLVTPWSSILNVAVGFVMFIYIIVPLCYWKFNTFDARKFPIFSNQLFTHAGQKYDTTKILTPQYDLNIAAYNSYGKLYLSPLFALSIGSGFARFTATLTHVALFHGSAILKQSRSAMKNVKVDIHTRLMSKYKQVPEWWFLILLLASMVLSLVMCFVWKSDVQLPWWGMLFAFALAFIVTLPIGIIQATTNQQPGYDIIAQFIIGYVLPGKPIANLLFKMYGRLSTVHALSFLSDLKLGHYMKIPPRCMYTAQLVGTLVSGTVNLAVAWWMLGSIENICDVEALHPESPWTCPKFRVTFDASVIWGLIGPERLFGPGGLYRNLVWLFLIGAVLPVPVWILSKIYPEKKWIALINIPVISYGFAGMPPATPTNIACWLITGTIFNYFVFRYRKRWWQKYNYVLSAALDAGTAFMAVLLFFALQNEGHNLKWWGSEPDHCPLATCPTQPGIVVKGCPVF